MAIDWMAGLEEKVREAGQEIRRLRAEKDELNERIATLEAEVEEIGAARAVATSAGTEANGAHAADTAWEQEREEVRRRVEKLVAQLEGLIREAESSDA